MPIGATLKDHLAGLILGTFRHCRRGAKMCTSRYSGTILPPAVRDRDAGGRMRSGSGFAAELVHLEEMAMLFVEVLEGRTGVVYPIEE